MARAKIIQFTNVEKLDTDFACTERFRYYLLENPNLSYVTCLVGPKKVTIRISKRHIKKNASPEIVEIMEDEHDFVVVRLEKTGYMYGIHLPEFDPGAFKLYKKLVTGTCFEDCLQLKISPDRLFSLVEISKLFGTTLYQKGFESLLRRIFQKPDDFFKSPEFHNLSSKNMEKLLSEDWITACEVDIFRNVCRWAATTCVKRGLGFTPLNLRNSWGNCIFEIRFHWMTRKQFHQYVEPWEILTAEEKSVIYERISALEIYGHFFDSSSLEFKVTQRKTTITSGSWAAADLLQKNNLKIERSRKVQKFPCEL